MGKDSLTGELFTTTQTGVTVKDARSKPITMWVDPGFDSSPLAGHPFDELLAKKAVDALGDKAGFEQVRQAVLSETRLKAWRGFVDNTFDSGIRNTKGDPVIQGQSMTVGILTPDTVRMLASKGRNFAPVLSVDDRLLIGKKALRHGATGDALNQSDWMNIPTQLPDAFPYWDKDTNRLVLVYARNVPEQCVQLVFVESGEAVSAYSVDDNMIKDKVQRKRWEQIK